MPTWMPTTPPTRHPCTDGSHGCDKGPCGVCNEVGDGWECGCAPECTCVGGCDKPHYGHKCEKTKAPTLAPTTKAPTWMPTKTPTTKAPTWTPTKTPTTKAPTKAPTIGPTYHPCRDGSHGCDEGPCGVCNEVGDGWECGCAPECTCVGGCDKPHYGHKCVKTKAPTWMPTNYPSNYPTNAPTWMPTKTPTTKAPTWMPTK